MRRTGWAAGLGLAGLLAACGQAEVRRGEPYYPPSVAEQEAALFGGMDYAAMPAAHRAALVTAHAEAAFALYRAGETEAAKAHLQTIDSAREPVLMLGLETLGYDPQAIRTVYEHMESGVPGREADTVMEAARAMLAQLRAGAGGQTGETVEFLMKTLARNFETGAEAGTITDPQAYQMAYGLAVAARDLAGSGEPETYGDLQRELDFLVLMWPRGGPVSTAVAPPELQIAEQLSRVKLALAALP